MKVVGFRAGIAVCLSVTLFACSHAPATVPDYPFTAAQRSAVDSVLQHHPDWRLARRANHTSKDIAQSPASYEPYFARDSLSPAQPDFAVAFVHGRDFIVYWFRASSGKYLPGAEVSTCDWLQDGGLRFLDGHLEMAPLASDEIFAFRWNARTAAPEVIPDSTGH